MNTNRRFCALLAGLFTVAALSAAGTDALTVSVVGQVAHDYQRARKPDGSFKPERYVIANGGKFPGTVRDASFDKVSYPQVAGVVGQYLASQRYFLAKKAADADLLIVIYWGETIPFNDTNYGIAVDQMAGAVRKADPQPTIAQRMQGTAPVDRTPVDNTAVEYAAALVEMEDSHRDALNIDNAKVLGYVDAVNDARWRLAWADVGGLKQDLMDDIEESRYYVVVGAYDFRELQRTGKKVPRWVTRISIGAHGTSFDERVRQMVASAASAFGQGQGLHRRYYGDPRVDLGEIKYLGQTSLPDAPAKDTREK